MEVTSTGSEENEQKYKGGQREAAPLLFFTKEIVSGGRRLRKRKRVITTSQARQSVWLDSGSWSHIVTNPESEAPNSKKPLYLNLQSKTDFNMCSWSLFKAKYCGFRIRPALSYR